VDGSPCGYVAWYNYYNNASRIRTIHPLVKNDRFAVQRMEMLAIYFAITDNSFHFANIMKQKKMLRQNRRELEQQLFTIDIRSDSKSTIEQLRGLSEIRNRMLQRIYVAIKRALNEITFPYAVIFTYLERTRNIAGLMLEQLGRKRRERLILSTSFSNITKYGRNIALPSKINVNWGQEQIGYLPSLPI
jgi:hypothetical protein